MSQRFLNGMAWAKAQMTISLLAEIQGLNAQCVLDLHPVDLETLQDAARVLSDISNKLREADHNKEEP